MTPRQNFSYSLLSECTGHWSDAKRVGSGGSGSVYYARLPSGTPAAVKRLDDATSTREQAHEAWRTELALLSQVVHPNVVPLLGASADGPSHCLVYQYCEGGSVEQRLQRSLRGRPPLSVRQRLTILSDVVRGLAHLHGVGLIHRDIKPANILLDGGAVTPTARIGDFGVARALEIQGGIGIGSSASSRGTTMVSRSRSFASAGVAGTLVYIAPEYLKGGACSARVDAFAYGLLVVEVLTGRRAAAPQTHRTEATGRTSGHAEASYESLLDLWYEVLLDAPEELMRVLDPRAEDDGCGAWTAHADSVRSLHAIAQGCLEPIRKRRSEVCDLVDALESVRAAALETSEELRDEFRCPLSLEVMEDPVVAADGNTYERLQIELWLKGHDVSPLTNEVMAHKFLSPNLALKKLIAEAQEQDTRRA